MIPRHEVGPEGINSDKLTKTMLEVSWKDNLL